MKIYISVTFILLGLASFGQIDVKKPINEVFINAQAIKKNKISSVTVFADISMSGIHKYGSESGKYMEMTFDADGNRIYKLTCDGHGNLPFLTYGRGSVIEVNSYDESGLLLTSYREDRSRKSEMINEYDKSGNLITSAYKHNDELLFKRAFVWEGGSMSNTEMVFANELNKDKKVDFDEKGRRIADDWGKTHRKLKYEDGTDTLTTSIFSYQADTLISVLTYSTLVKFEGQLTKYVLKDNLNQIQVEMKTEYDAHGNATSYYYYDRRSNPYEEVHKPASYKIKNTYDKAGLIVKRALYVSKRGVGVNVLVKVQRYVYETIPLDFQFEKGVIRRREEDMTPYDR